MPKPFEHKIFLFDTHVAGIEALDPFLKVNNKLDFFREPQNAHDERAIVINNASGMKIGYVPQQNNVNCSRLINAEEKLFDSIAAKEW